MRDNPREVNAAFTSRHGDGKGLNSIQRLNLRYGVAKTMVSKLPSGMVNELERTADVLHVADMDEWNMTLSDISSAKDVSQYVSIPLFWISLTYLSRLGLATASSMLSSLFLRASVSTLAAMLLSLPEMLGRMITMKAFSPRRSISSLSRVISLLIYKNSVHWWPGDRSATKNWTKWNEDEFNSGVAGSFLAYAAENSMFFYYYETHPSR